MSDEAVELRQQRIVLALQIALPIIAIASFSTRIYVRTKILRRVSIDDWAMGAALILYFFTCIAGYLMYSQEQVLVSVGKSQVILALTSLFIYIKLFYSFYTLTITTVKVSLGFFFLHFFNINQRIQRGLIYSMVGVSTAFGIAIVGLEAGTCGLGSLVAKCEIGNAFNALSNTWNIVNSGTDFVFLGLSIHAIWGIQLKTYLKVSTICLLALACAGGALSVVRAVTVAKAQQLARDQQGVQVVLIGRWSTLEAGLYIITGCLATLKPLLQMIRERLETYYRTWNTPKDTLFREEFIGQPLEHVREDSLPVKGGVASQLFIVQMEVDKV
ncbi:hypothetical protein K461DRAFT_295019 [Myriangium duriaei CBS 260.36]|uniref:Rhodopsin domain-containing protein n=1 Tax=Myriangium duriaei CBS 260.36 TaxID=1168546 RepID=A0A9P4ME97_9PEZI|nr:hypothetical protein K461DRAFT_295019 [Myriangium duriaei CBS 260.36]